MDGMYKTYEKLRGRSFSALTNNLHIISDMLKFGINYVVNAETLPQLNEAIDFAERIGASEFLLLPEQPTRNAVGISQDTRLQLQDFVKNYSSNIRLSVSELGADGFPICNPWGNNCDNLSYAHIDALGIIKNSSYDSKGILIDENGAMFALNKLSTLN